MKKNGKLARKKHNIIKQNNANHTCNYHFSLKGNATIKFSETITVVAEICVLHNFPERVGHVLWHYNFQKFSDLGHKIHVCLINHYNEHDTTSLLSDYNE